MACLSAALAAFCLQFREAGNENVLLRTWILQGKCPSPFVDVTKAYAITLSQAQYVFYLLVGR